MSRPADDLTQATGQLGEDGWCIVPDVLDGAGCAETLSRLWSAAEEGERRGIPTFLPILDVNASNVRVFYLLERDAIFRDLIQHPLAVDIVRSLIGERFLISNFTANIAQPGWQSMVLHSDLAIVVPGPWEHPWSINIIWCLTDVTFENGATLYIPGSHRWRTRADVPPDAIKRLRPFEAKAGSIIAMDGRMWHTSGANITPDQDRALLFGYYTAPFLRPQVNWNACLSDATQAGLGPRLRDWLGLDVNANVGNTMDLHPSRAQVAHRSEPA
jgi:fumagillin biosynthesis dioxygenase